MTTIGTVAFTLVVFILPKGEAYSRRFVHMSSTLPANNFKTTNGIFIKLGLYIHVHGNEWKDSSQETLTYLYIY